jgi:hypothetical protein
MAHYFNLNMNPISPTCPTWDAKAMSVFQCDSDRIIAGRMPPLHDFALPRSPFRPEIVCKLLRMTWEYHGRAIWYDWRHLSHSKRESEQQ